jgi:hypothetical protein
MQVLDEGRIRNPPVGAGSPGEPGYAEAAAWDKAMNFEFHEERTTDERMLVSIARSRVDHAVCTGADQDGQLVPRSLGSEVPR